jgi:hypothetical protein
MQEKNASFEASLAPFVSTGGHGLRVGVPHFWH